MNTKIDGIFFLLIIFFDTFLYLLIKFLPLLYRIFIYIIFSLHISYLHTGPATLSAENKKIYEFA